MPKTLEREWEFELPASKPEEVLAGLAARDRLFGQTITMEPEEDPAKSVEVWIGTSDALADAVYHLGVYAELSGAKEYLEPAADALAEIFEEQIQAGTADAEAATLLDRRAASAIIFKAVAENDELPQLVLPEWLAPEGAELPWGFQAVTPDGQAWPSKKLLESHDRIAVVPFGDEVLLYALPALEDGEEE
jgi:hypothetical protein